MVPISRIVKTGALTVYDQFEQTLTYAMARSRMGINVAK